MKLNEHDKNDLRKKIEEAVKNVPDGQRIELPLELLDELIFLKIKDKKDITIKFPVWTGEFLRKIDLSKLSFEHVYWDVGIYCSGDKDDKFELYKLSSFYHNGDEDYVVPIVGHPELSTMSVWDAQGKDCLIDFSYTNINPDLSNMNYIKSTNFEGVDLSSVNLNSKIFENCNLKDTGAKLEKKVLDDFYSIQGTNFTNCNLMFITLDFNEFLDGLDETNLFAFPIFTNTGLKIIFNKEKADDDVNGLVSALCLSGKLDGCYLNGKLIDSTKVNKIKPDKQTLLEEYKNLKNEIFETTLGSIEEQIKGFKGK